MAVDAIHSLFNSRQAKNPGKLRPQEILTPGFILGPIEKAMLGIEIDPCASTDSSRWFAKTNFTLPEDVETLRQELDTPGLTVRQRAKIHAKIKSFTLAGGLTADWGCRSVYLNPPYDTLRPWMKRFSEHLCGPIAMLCPVRTNRLWWHECAVTAGTVIMLKPIAFSGQKSAFPAPLCVMVRNMDFPDFGDLELRSMKWPRA